MSSQVLTVGEALWIRAPEETAPSTLGSFGQDVIGTPAASDRQSVRVVMDEFVARVRDNPKVWAVYASQEGSVIHVWTYVDSNDRKDRSPVYAAEWDLFTHYPKVDFDFNVALVPVDSEQFEVGKGTYLYKR